MAPSKSVDAEEWATAGQTARALHRAASMRVSHVVQQQFNRAYDRRLGDPNGYAVLLLRAAMTITANLFILRLTSSSARRDQPSYEYEYHQYDKTASAYEYEYSFQ